MRCLRIVVVSPQSSAVPSVNPKNPKSWLVLVLTLPQYSTGTVRAKRTDGQLQHGKSLLNGIGLETLCHSEAALARNLHSLSVLQWLPCACGSPNTPLMHANLFLAKHALESFEMKPIADEGGLSWGEGMWVDGEVEESSWGEKMWVDGDACVGGCDGEGGMGGWEDEGTSYCWWPCGVVKTSLVMKVSHGMPFFCIWCITTIFISGWWNRLCIY